MAEPPKPPERELNEAVPAPGRLDAKSTARRGKKESGHDLLNRQLGDFLLLRRLGAGGMGEVYLAQQQSLKRQVALKVLRPETMSDETARKRFEVEAEAAAKLTHSNIVQIYASGQESGINYMALEYVQGMNLRDYVTKKGPVPVRFGLRVIEQVAAALQHAAQAGIVHRDIKPDNILLTRKGEVKVGDFGLARLRMEKPQHLTQTGVTMGTPLYMSPEQVEGRALDSRSDLYSLGAMSYYMLSGRPPYRGETALSIAVQHIKSEPEPLATIRPDLPGELCRIVQKLMAKNPDQRYQSGRQVMRDVQKLRAELAQLADAAVGGETQWSIPLETPSESHGDNLFRRTFSFQTMRRYVWSWFAASLALALLAGMGYGWYSRAPDLRAREQDIAAPVPPPRWQDIPKKESAESQYKFATWAGQDVSVEAAWLAVIQYWSIEPDWVVLAQLELGKHYLFERQFEKAQALFGEMNTAPDERTRFAGEVGRTMLLAFRGRPAESQSALWELVRDSGFGLERKPPGGPGALTDRTLLNMILWTFERNYRDLGRGWDWDKDVKAWANRRLQRLRPFSPRGPEQMPGPPSRSPDGQRDASRG